MKIDIADDVDDTNNTYSSAIIKAIQGAQRDCERYNFYFNETRDVTFLTVAAQQWYTATDNANIGTLIRIQQAYKTDSSGQTTTLTPVTPEEIETLSDSSASTGEPYCWTYFNKQIALYPIPDSMEWTIRLQLGAYRLGAVADESETNAWLDDGYDMIKARAKYRLYKNTIKDATLAVEALNDYHEQKKLLDMETSSRQGIGIIQATDF